ASLRAAASPMPEVGPVISAVESARSFVMSAPGFGNLLPKPYVANFGKSNPILERDARPARPARLGRAGRWRRSSCCRNDRHRVVDWDPRLSSVEVRIFVQLRICTAERPT